MRPWSPGEYINAGACGLQFLLAAFAWATTPPNETTLSRCVVGLMLAAITSMNVYWFVMSRRDAIREWERSRE